MSWYPVINGYLFRLFLKYFIANFLFVVMVILISNSFDIINKFHSSDISLFSFWKLVLFRIPFLLNEVSVLIVFLAAVFFIRNLVSNNEMIILLSSGMQIWKIFLVPIATTILLGLIFIFIMNPLSSFCLQKYEELEASIFGRANNTISVSETGLFLYEKYNESKRLIHAHSLEFSAKKIHQPIILILDDENNFIKRIDAQEAILDNGSLTFINAEISTLNTTTKLATEELPTNLSIENVVARFSSPEMIHLWNLKNSMENFAHSGLLIKKYEIYYYKQIFKPIAMVAMVLIAFWFISLNVRDNGNIKSIILSIVIGIASFFLIEISTRILIYSEISTFFACLLPSIAIIFISNFVILHFQEA